MKDIWDGKDFVNPSLERLTAMTTKFLRKNFAFMDFENLLLLSKQSDGETFCEIDQWVKEAYLKSVGQSSESRSIELENYTINRCASWNNVSLGDNLRSGFFGFFSRLMNRGRAESLPL